KFEDLLNQVQNNLEGRRVKRVLADATHDTRENFNFLKRNGIKSGIRIRKSASTKPRWSPYRAKCVRELRKLGKKEWKEKYGYGKRWAAESHFSAVKRMFGENLRATSFEGMIREVKMKFLFYNMIAQAV
ncbi:MAG: transposase, partial [Candidatus Methanofastidiosia archaeon]